MPTSTNRQRPAAAPTRALLGVLLLVPLVGGCAFGDRVMLMKEFQSSLAEKRFPGLDGKTVCVSGFTDSTDVTIKWTETQTAPAPDEFVYREMTKDAAKSWDQELAERKQDKSVADFPVVGWMRNGFGMHTADVRTVNPPSEWLQQVLELELQGQGARLAPAASADIVISGVIRYRKVDIYMSNWANLVVDFEIQVRGRPPVRKTIHTSGKQVAWSSSAFEFYRAFRRCQQQTIWLLLAELAKLTE